MRNFYLKKTTFLFSSLIFFSSVAFQQEPRLVLTPRIAPANIVNMPVQVVTAGDGSNRVFVGGQGGSGLAPVLVYDQNYNKLDTFLKMTNITMDGERGLLSMAFHPEYGNPASPFFAAANVAAGAQYNFSHSISYPGRLFYRLKMINIDNSSELSNVVSVERSITNKSFVRPSFITSGVITMFLDRSYKIVELISIKGTVVLKQSIDGRTGRIDIAASFVAAGTYIVRLRNNETSLEQKVIIR